MNYELNSFKTRPAALTHAAVVEDLRNWQLMTGRALPYPPQWIASAEASGVVVDLVSGELFYDDEPVTVVPETSLIKERFYSASGVTAC